MEDMRAITKYTSHDLHTSTTDGRDDVSDGDSFDAARTASDKRRELESHYQTLYAGVVAELSTKIRRHPDCVADGLASALYEVSYLRARDYLQAAGRRQKQQENSKTITHASMQATPVVVRNCYSAREVRQAHSAVKSVSRALQVCWTICGSRLCKIKAKAIEKKKLSHTAPSTTSQREALRQSVSRTSVSTILGGVSDRKFKPAISLSFVPPPPPKI